MAVQCSVQCWLWRWLLGGRSQPEPAQLHLVGRGGGS